MIIRPMTPEQYGKALADLRGAMRQAMAGCDVAFAAFCAAAQNTADAFERLNRAIDRDKETSAG